LTQSQIFIKDLKKNNSFDVKNFVRMYANK